MSERIKQVKYLHCFDRKINEPGGNINLPI